MIPLVMASPPSIDPAPYVTPPRITVRSGLSLSKMLLRVVPTEAGPGVMGAAKTLRVAVTELDGKWKASDKAQRTKDVRPLEVQLERVWSVIESSLDRYAVLRTPKAKRQLAGALHEELFSEGLGFLEQRHVEQHAESARRIELIEDEGLRDGLEDLVGKEFVDELHAAHAAYAEALGITEAGKEATAAAESLLEPLRTLRRAIGAYALQVLAFAGVDPGNLTVARRALEPIDGLRAAASRVTATGGVGEPEREDEDAALPEGAPDSEDEIPELPEG